MRRGSCIFADVTLVMTCQWPLNLFRVKISAVLHKSSMYLSMQDLECNSRLVRALSFLKSSPNPEDPSFLNPNPFDPTQSICAASIAFCKRIVPISTVLNLKAKILRFRAQSVLVVCLWPWASCNIFQYRYDLDSRPIWTRNNSVIL